MSYTKELRVSLRNWGNPDMGQDPRRPVPDTEGPMLVDVADWEEASAVCLAYIASNDLGAGNWHAGAGHIYRADGSITIAYVSYNGKVWAGSPAQWQGAECLYNPYGG